jgi:predicted peroxiredoxin
MIMKKLSLLFILCLFAMSCNQAPQHEVTSALPADNPTVAGAVGDGVFIHITECYDDPHRALMPLKMATMMAADKDVLVYMDIHAVHLLTKNSKDLNFADFESAHTYIKRLIEMKVGVYACPTCMKVAGIEPADLMEGVQVAQKDKFFNFTKGRIITLDY